MNTVALTGRITRELELRKTPSNMSVCQFTIAVDKEYKQQGQPTADFINCVAWQSSAEYLTNYAHKGDKIELTGRLQSRSYDKDGHTNYVTEVVVARLSIVARVQGQTSQPARTESSDMNFEPDDLPFY